MLPMPIKQERLTFLGSDQPVYSEWWLRQSYLAYIELQLQCNMEAHNIGQHKPSVKVNHNPGGQSSFSLYWNEPEKNVKIKPANIQKYRNESHFAFNEQEAKELSEEERKKQEEARKQQEEAKKKEELNSKLPGYDPKMGGKSSLSFGNEPTDYRKKDEVFTSVKVKNPPGGRSNIQFG